MNSPRRSGFSGGVQIARLGDRPVEPTGFMVGLLLLKHHAAMPYAELPAFFAELAQRETVSAKALAFTILTAARSNETRGATVHEIDFDAALWIVPSDRIKSGREHRVPLADPAMAILRSLSHFHQDPDSVLFPNRGGKPMSDSALRKVLKEVMGHPELTLRGFRSTFRDWAAEETNYRRELAEAALAHVVKDKTRGPSAPIFRPTRPYDELFGGAQVLRPETAQTCDIDYFLSPGTGSTSGTWALFTENDLANSGHHQPNL